MLSIDVLDKKVKSQVLGNHQIFLIQIISKLKIIFDNEYK